MLLGQPLIDMVEFRCCLHDLNGLPRLLPPGEEQRANQTGIDLIFNLFLFYPEGFLILNHYLPLDEHLFEPVLLPDLNGNPGHLPSQFRLFDKFIPGRYLALGSLHLEAEPGIIHELPLLNILVLVHDKHLEILSQFDFLLVHLPRPQQLLLLGPEHPELHGKRYGFLHPFLHDQLAHQILSLLLLASGSPALQDSLFHAHLVHCLARSLENPIPRILLEQSEVFRLHDVSDRNYVQIKCIVVFLSQPFGRLPLTETAEYGLILRL